MKYINLKTVNKFFAFCATIIILFNIFALTTNYNAATDYLALGCDTKSNSTTRNSAVEAAIEEYYMNERKMNVQTGDFKCYIGSLNPVERQKYQEVMVTYRDANNALKHSSAFTKIQFDMDDLLIDIDDGKLVVSNLLVSDIDAWNRIYNSISGVIAGLSGLGILCCLMAFIIQIIKLGASAGNPADREKAIRGLLWTGIGTAGCGAAALIFGLAYSLI